MEKKNETSMFKKGNYRFGRIVIRIPVSKYSLNENVISAYLPYIMMMHASNVADYMHLDMVYRGNSNIWQKERQFVDDASEKMNAIVEEGHPFSMVEFKKGYMYGDDVKYSCADDTMCTDDITIINRYMKSQNKSSKNVEIAQDVYVAGSGNRIVLPKPLGIDYDISRDAPFDIYNLEYCNSFIVYSSNFTKEKLFGGIITTIDSTDPNNVIYQLMIYDHMWAYEFYIGGNATGFYFDSGRFVKKTRHYIGICPFVEWRINKVRMGIVERVESLCDAVNTISSNSVDNVVDFVNSILVVYNQNIDKKAKKEVDQNGAMSLNTIDPSRPADAKYLTNLLNNADVNTKYEALVKVAYALVGVPQANTQTTSGGDTGEARLLGGGWARADIVAKQDEILLKDSEREMLEIVINICSKHPQCEINDIYASDIEINFSGTKNDNLLVKVQALTQLIQMNVPKEVALNIVGLVGDPHEVAHAWEDEVKKAQQRSLEMMQQKQSNPNKDDKQNNQDDLENKPKQDEKDTS